MRRLLRKLFGRKGQSEIPLREKYPQHDIGRGSYGHLRVRNGKNHTKLKIGAFCSFASGVQVFLGGEHRTDWVSTFPFPAMWENVGDHFEGWDSSRGDVNIGNDVWIGTEALVMSGVSIGNGAVVGARAVVTKDVPAYAIVAGIPAKIIRMRFEGPIIARLEAVAWWHWNDEKIARLMPLLLSGNVEAFLGVAEGKEREFAALA